MPQHGPDIIKRYDRLVNEAQNHRQRAEEMAPYIAPSRVGITSSRSPGQKLNPNTFDSTGLMAAELMAMFVSGSIMNPGQQWGSHSMRDPRLRQDDAVQEWLEECRDRMLREFAASMFYAEASESLIDWGGFGTGFCLLEEQPVASHVSRPGFRGFFVEAQKTGRFVIADGANGLVDTAMREFNMTARIIRDRWPQATLPESIQAALEKGESDKTYTVIHAITPRTLSEQRAGAGATAMPWASCWVEKESKAIVHESGYRLFPGAVPRYLRTPGEVYGRGRGDIAYNDIWTLNQAKRMGFEDWALKLQPPMLIRHDSVIGTLRLVPAGHTSVNTHGQNIRDVMMPYETGSNPQLNAIKEEELRKSIRQIFFVDQILALMEVNKSEMTAFEFAKKLEILFTLMGPVYGRTEREFLRPLWDVGFDLMFEAGAFSPPPSILMESDGEIDVIFENPLARSRRTGDVEAIALAVQDMAALGQMFPQMWDGFDPDKTRQHIFTVRGVPASVTRNADEIEALREERAKQQQQELEMATMQQATESMKNAAPLMKVLAEPRNGA